MAKVTLSDAVSVVEVEVFGTMFEGLPPTRSVIKALSESDGALEAAVESKDEDKQVEAIGLQLDARLKPVNGARKKASTILLEQWMADKLSLSEMMTFVEDLNEAQLARPT